MPEPDVAGMADGVCEVPIPPGYPEVLVRALAFVTMADDYECKAWAPQTEAVSTTDDGGARYHRITQVVAANEADKTDEEIARQESAGPTT